MSKQKVDGQRMLELWRVTLSNYHKKDIGRIYFLYGADSKDIMQQSEILQKCHPNATSIEIGPAMQGVRVGPLLIPESLSEQEYKRVPTVEEARARLAEINEKQALLDSMEDSKSDEAVKLEKQITDLVFWLFERSVDIVIQPKEPITWGFGK